MRVTFVLAGRGLYGGVRVIASHANHLVDRGHQVTIVCLRQPLPRRPIALARRLYRDARVAGGFDRDHLHGFRGRLVCVRPERLAADAPDGDVVIATLWTTAQAVADLPARCGSKCYFIQGYDGQVWDPAKVDATWRLPLRKITVANWLAELAADQFDDESAIVVPNGIDPRQFHAAIRDMNDPPVVGVTYSSDGFKGSAVAFAAVRNARRRIPKLRLVCFGAERPRAGELPEGASFHYRPPQSALSGIYGSADVWLCASKLEGFGLPPLEAMACRCPVVVTRCKGPEEFVQEGVNGFLVNVGDADAMAERVVELLGDPARWRRMSDAALATSQQYALSDSADRFESALAAIGEGANVVLAGGRA